jgi:hypothetical protein
MLLKILKIRLISKLGLFEGLKDIFNNFNLTN